VPVVLTAFVGGGIFNPFWVGVITAIGASIGELTGYLAGAAGQIVVAKDPRLQKIEGWMHKYGLGALFVLAAIPNPAFDLAGIVAGATRIPVWKYFLAVTLGKMIKFFIFALLGFYLTN